LDSGWVIYANGTQQSWVGTLLNDLSQGQKVEFEEQDLLSIKRI
jgi:hypothetical protein